MTRLPKNRPPIHPGEILLEEFLNPLGMTQVALAEAIHVSVQRVNEIVKGKRGVSPDTALRLARLFNTTADVWLNLQQRYDLWNAIHSKEASAIDHIQPLAMVAGR